jgi:hypothetical protein
MLGLLVNTIQYCSILFNTVQYCSIPFNTIQYHSIPFNTIQYHSIPFNTVQYRSIPFNTVQYRSIPFNTIKYSRSSSLSMFTRSATKHPRRKTFNYATPRTWTSNTALTRRHWRHFGRLTTTFRYVPPPSTNNVVQSTFRLN